MMKVRKLLGGMLAGALLLTSVPLAGAVGAPIKAEAAETDVSNAVIAYPGVDGNIKFTNEQVATVNAFNNLCITVLVKFNTITANRAYSLFTLEAENENNDGEFYTVWYAPNVNNVGCVGYSYKGSQGGSFWSGRNNGSGNGNNGRHDTTGEWHKVTLCVNSNNSHITAVDDEQVRYVASPGNHINAKIRTTQYTAGYGKGLSTKKYTLNGTETNRYTALTGSFGNNAPLDLDGEIKYVIIQDAQYTSTTGDSTRDTNKTSLLGNVQLAPMDSVKTTFLSAKSLLTSAVEDDYKPSSWEEFSAANNAINLSDQVTSLDKDTYNLNDWTAYNYIDQMKTATSKLNVCFHNYVNGTCTHTDCQRKRTDKTYTVTIHEGGSTRTITDIPYGGIRCVTAAGNLGDQSFSHWSNKLDGSTKLSYDQKYDFYVTKTMDLYAIYADEAPTTKSATIEISNTYARKVDGRNRLYFEATRHVPDDYFMTLVEHGILYTTDPSVANIVDGLQIATDTDFSPENGAKKSVGRGTANNGVYTFTAAVGDANTGKTVYARAYMVFKAEYTVGTTTSTVYYPAYSEQVEVTYDGLISSQQ